MENKIAGQGLAPAVKKLLSLLLAITMLFSITAGIEFSAYAEMNKDYDYFILEDGTAEIESYLGSETDVRIPAIIDGYKVTGLGLEAFENNEELTSVYIPDSVTSIFNNSFYGCSALKEINVDPNNKCFASVDGTLYNKAKTELIKYAGAKAGSSFTIPNSVTKITAWSFDCAYNLTNISVPNTIEVIEECAFTNSGYFDNADNWNNGVLYIGNYLLSADEDADLGAYSIKNGTTLIADNAFEYCYGLTSVTIPNSVKSIGDYVFYGCDSLKNVVIPNSVTTLGDCIFFNCGSLVSATISSSIAKLGDYMFAVCAQLKDFTVPSNIKAIGNGTFYGCENLNTITIPTSVTSLGDEVFAACIRLTGITIPNSVKSIGEYAFAACSKLANVVLPNSIKSLESDTFYGCEGLKSITIPEGVVSIGDKAFADCTRLSSVTIPDNVATISDYAFNGCLNLKSLTILNKNAEIGKASVPKSTTIFGYKNSTAETFANENSIKFSALDVACSHAWNNGEVTNPASCIATGVKTYTCSICRETKTETIAKNAHTYKTTTTKATTSKNGSVVTKCSVCGAKKSSSTIYYPKTISLSATSYTYDGKAKQPSVTVKDSNGKKIASSNYTVKYSNNKSVGKATVTITFKGNYSGTITKTFTIKPKATTLSSVTAKSKGFTVKWKKLTTQTTGYQIQYSTSSKFSNAKTVTVSKNSTTSKTVSKLKAKKKYYVRVRTYKTVKVNGKSTKIYSSWSKSKSIKTK
ncbi:MAG: leucine-rich repeat protein [Eubacterium sp.]|nr:leucine-rich repeat protein [Eubacterium sp.]